MGGGACSEKHWEGVGEPGNGSSRESGLSSGSMRPTGPPKVGTAPTPARLGVVFLSPPLDFVSRTRVELGRRGPAPGVGPLSPGNLWVGWSGRTEPEPRLGEVAGHQELAVRLGA
jgi:hypothetical protein